MSASCQVDFYVLSRPDQSADHFACRLAVMAWEQGHRVAVCTPGAEHAQRLDALMWEHPPGRFLPHEAGADDGAAPVHVLAGNREIAAHRDLVINLCPDAVPDPGRFVRLCEIVPADPADREASRHKFRPYRDAGLAPEHHPMG